MRSFFVPMGVEELLVEVRLREHGTVSFFLYDPLRRLRKSGCSSSKVIHLVLKEHKDGKINYGEWTLEIVSRLDGEEVECEIKVDFSRTFVKPRWYRGELHTHTKASDGEWSVDELARILREHGVEFFFVTDHNVFGISKPKRLNGVMVYPGIEITAAGGHVLVLDPDEKLHLSNCDNYISGVAHPFFPKTKSCPDCPFEKPWRHDFVEIWNSDFETDEFISYNEMALEAYKENVRTRYMAPVATGDVHNEKSLVHWIPTHFLLPDLSFEFVLNSVVEGLVACGNVTFFESSFLLPNDTVTLINGEQVSTKAIENFHALNQLEVRNKEGQLLLFCNFKLPLIRYL